MTYAKVATTFILLTFLTIGLSVQPASAASNTPTCQPKPLDTLKLPLEAGDLLYTDNGQIISLQGSFAPVRANADGARISPNGEYIATTADDNSGRWTEVYNRSGERIYAGAPVNGFISGLYWLGDEKLLAFFTYHVHRDSLSSVGGASFLGDYVEIDPFARNYTYFHPNPRTSPFYNEDSSSVFAGGYNLTFDGRYFLTSNVLFDFETDQVLFDRRNDKRLAFQNFGPGFPALNSYRLINADSAKFETAGEYSVLVYDFDSDTYTQIASFKPETHINWIEGGWSPDEKQLAYSLYPEENTTFSRLELLQLDSGQITPTCLGSGYELHWSRDSRYLALYGVLENEPDREIGSLYLYDTQTNDIYEVHHGDSGIIGWMANPNS